MCGEDRVASLEKEIAELRAVLVQVSESVMKMGEKTQQRLHRLETILDSVLNGHRGQM